MENTSKAYWNSLQSTYSTRSPFNRDDIASLTEIYSGSLQIYESFIKNFNRDGVHQRELLDSIQNWYTNQAVLGSNSLIEAYKIYGETSQPAAIVFSLSFYGAPRKVKERIGAFLRNDILNNEDFINTEDRHKLGARVYGLIGLNSFGISTEEEKELFNKAIEQGIIKYYSPHSFFGSPTIPLPE